MDEQQEQKLRALTAKADLLNIEQQKLALEISNLRNDLKSLTAAPSTTSPDKVAIPFPVDIPKPSVTAPQKIEIAFPPIPSSTPTNVPKQVVNNPPKDRTAIEEFIGTNLLNKIGIAVLVIGLGIGVKYSIDHQLINPLTRIILGYIAGIVLIALAMRLKPNPKYVTFSAVLLSGGMATLYFMTFAAYGIYELIPQILAFMMMVIFTAFTVFAAIQYNMQVIAIIGLVGAYAVPFLLSDGSGRVVILFSYISIINIGILILSFKKNWKVLHYTAFGLTWLIFAAWFSSSYDASKLFVSLLFLTIFFATFYTIFLAYKISQKEKLEIIDIVLLSCNTVIFYGFGYAAINEAPQGDLYLGLFTVFNALLHFIACVIIYKKQDASRDIFYLLAGMVLMFLTLAVPVQFDGQWVTLIWAFEALLMFWIGRVKGFPIYERIAYGLIALTFAGVVYDWLIYYGQQDFEGEPFHRLAFFNIQVFSSLLVVGTWGAILYLKNKHQAEQKEKQFLNAIDWMLPSLVLVVLFFTFYLEINAFWHQRYYENAVDIKGEYEYKQYNGDYLYFNTITLLIYASLFTIGLWALNVRRLKSKVISYVVASVSPSLLVIFITEGFLAIYHLRTSYLEPNHVDLFDHGVFNIVLRYICFVTVLPLLWVNHKVVGEAEFAPALKNAFTILSIAVVLLVLSSELISILDHTRIEDSDRLALSILWSFYALALIVYGLKKDLKLIRIVAITLFGITLGKVFLYDMSEMTTIAKTIVMVILGALLLIASFIYNKFKKVKNDA